jgi:rare lipoprotein A
MLRALKPGGSVARDSGRHPTFVRILVLCALLFSFLTSHDVTPVRSDITRRPSDNRIDARQDIGPGRTRVQRARRQYGLASFYSSYFDRRRTADGRRFDNDSMVAAHPTYPLGTVVRVTNLKNHRSVTVRIVDRGPAPRIRRRGVIIDVSRAAAESLGFVRAGRTRVRVDVIQSATA